MLHSHSGLILLIRMTLLTLNLALVTGEGVCVKGEQREGSFSSLLGALVDVQCQNSGMFFVQFPVVMFARLCWIMGTKWPSCPSRLFRESVDCQIECDRPWQVGGTVQPVDFVLAVLLRAIRV